MSAAIKLRLVSAEGHSSEEILLARERYVRVPMPAGFRDSIPDLDDQAAIQNLTLADVITLYLDHVKARLERGDFDNENFANMKRSLSAFSLRFGSQRLVQCRRHNLDMWLKEHPSWHAPRTKKREIGYITACCNWAEDKQHITTNPYRAYRLDNVRLRPRNEATDEQYLDLMRTSPIELRRMICFQRHCGTRTCEPRELVWSDVHLDYSVIVQEEHKTSRQQQEPSARVIPLPRSIHLLLGILRRKRRSSIEHVFLDESGRPWTRDKICHAFKKYARICVRRRLKILSDSHPELLRIVPAGVDERSLAKMARELKQLVAKPHLQNLLALEKVSLYCFRHQKATELVEEGTPDQQICDLMGWSNSAMLKNYKHTAGKLSYFATLKTKLGRNKPSKPTRSRDLPTQGHLFDTTR